MIDDLSAIAKEAIRQAGAEAARAAVLASIERQAELIQEKAAVMREAENTKANGKKNMLIGIMSGLLGGLVLGIAGTTLMSN